MARQNLSGSQASVPPANNLAQAEHDALNAGPSTVSNMIHSESIVDPAGVTCLIHLESNAASTDAEKRISKPLLANPPLVNPPLINPPPVNYGDPAGKVRNDGMNLFKLL